MAELEQVPPQSDCCSPEAQQACCEPTDKEACCEERGTGSCGCPAGY